MKYHKIIFTYLPGDAKIWLRLWDFILCNVSGEGAPASPEFFLPSLFLQKTGPVQPVSRKSPLRPLLHSPLPQPLHSPVPYPLHPLVSHSLHPPLFTSGHIAPGQI